MRLPRRSSFFQLQGRQSHSFADSLFRGTNDVNGQFDFHILDLMLILVHVHQRQVKSEGAAPTGMKSNKCPVDSACSPGVPLVSFLGICMSRMVS
jgi:hypothetical protein